MYRHFWFCLEPEKMLQTFKIIKKRFDVFPHVFSQKKFNTNKHT